MSESKEQDDTRTKILDTAQELFAKDGYHNPSLRKITSSAGVNLAAVNYHFGSKEALLKAVLERGFSPINQKRSERLLFIEKRTSEGITPTVLELFRAFIEPVIEHKRTGGVPTLFALIGRAVIEQDVTVRRIFHQIIEPTFVRLLNLLKIALPEKSEEEILWRTKFAMGSMGHLFCSGTLQGHLPFPGFNPDRPIEELAEMLISFIVAGMEAS